MYGTGTARESCALTCSRPRARRPGRNFEFPFLLSWRSLRRPLKDNKQQPTARWFIMSGASVTSNLTTTQSLPWVCLFVVFHQFVFIARLHLLVYQEAPVVMKRSFAVMAMSLSVVMPSPPIAAAYCLYFEAMPCAELTQIRGECHLEDLASNDALGEYGCCVDPLPNSCNCFVGGLLLADVDTDCDACGDGNSGSIKCTSSMEMLPNESTVAAEMADLMSSSMRATSITEEAGASTAATVRVPKGLCMTTFALGLAHFLLL